MRNADEAIVSFFTHVVEKDPKYLAKLERESEFTIEGDRWEFKLPALYRFLQRFDQNFRNMTYTEFRQIIYFSRINQTMKQNSAEIIIVDNHSNVDNSLYALVWQE